MTDDRSGKLVRTEKNEWIYIIHYVRYVILYPMHVQVSNENFELFAFHFLISSLNECMKNLRRRKEMEKNDDDGVGIKKFNFWV